MTDLLTAEVFLRYSTAPEKAAVCSAEKLWKKLLPISQTDSLYICRHILLQSSARRKQNIVGYKTEKYLYETALIGYFDDYVSEHYYGLDMNSFINNYKNEFAGSHKYYFATNEFDSYSFSAYGVLEIKKYYNGVSIFDSSVSEKKITYYSLLASMASKKEDILDGGVIFFGKA